MANFLDATGADPKLKIFENFFTGGNVDKDDTTFNPLLKPSISINPTPGFCIKTKDLSGEKIFFNICHCNEIPKPSHINEDELLELLQTKADTGFRVPMSLGECHREHDKKGVPCQAYDIIVNSEWYQETLEKSNLMNHFLISAVFEGIENKYHLELIREECLKLQNRKYLGSMPNHFIEDREKMSKLASITGQTDSELRLPSNVKSSKPLIEDITDQSDSTSNSTFQMKTAPTQSSTKTSSTHSDEPEWSGPMLDDLTSGRVSDSLSDLDPPFTSRTDENSDQKEKPLIVELPRLPEAETNEKPLVEEMQSKLTLLGDDDKKPAPEYKIFKYPPKGYPQFLRCLITLPNIIESCQLYLDIFVNSLKLNCIQYYLDLNLPYLVIRDEASAYFNKCNRTLTITMPIVPSCKR